MLFAATPLRIVFNASSCPAGGKSLNDCMHVGPSLTQKLHNTLLKSKENPVVVISNISKAFPRILVDEDHSKYTEFVWVTMGRAELACYQSKVVIFGVCSNPYILQEVLHTHLSKIC